MTNKELQELLTTFPLSAEIYVEGVDHWGESVGCKSATTIRGGVKDECWTTYKLIRDLTDAEQKTLEFILIRGEEKK